VLALAFVKLVPILSKCLLAMVTWRHHAGERPYAVYLLIRWRDCPDFHVSSLRSTPYRGTIARLLNCFSGGLVKLVIQIVAGILLAGLISSVCWFLYARWALYEAQREISAVVTQQQEELARRASAQSVQAQAQQDQRERSLRLKVGEACLGAVAGQAGTVVIRSVVNGVPQAVQLLEYGRPVKCVGDHRLE